VYFFKKSVEKNSSFVTIRQT